jgi:hypothetical protein
MGNWAATSLASVVLGPTSFPSDRRFPYGHVQI